MTARSSIFGSLQPTAAAWELMYSGDGHRGNDAYVKKDGKTLTKSHRNPKINKSLLTANAERAYQAAGRRQVGSDGFCVSGRKLNVSGRSLGLACSWPKVLLGYGTSTALQILPRLAPW